MGITVRSHFRPSAHRLLGGSLLLGAAITVAACGSSATTGSGSGSSPGAGSSAPAGTSSSAVSLSTKSVSGVGTVLVDGQGRTLYLLTSEKGGKVTCTPSNGCTKFWPEITLPKGTTAATAGTGVQSSLLGTVKDASGNLEVTYNGWPVYTFVGDSGPGVAHGQGQVSFGGTWYALNASGDPVTGSGGAQPATSPSSAGSGGYGY